LQYFYFIFKKKISYEEVLDIAVSEFDNTLCHGENPPSATGQQWHGSSKE